MNLQCSEVNNFKCCKTKVNTNYVCTKCFSIFHKSCVLRNKDKISFLTHNRIICCKNENDLSVSSEFDEEISILEKTVSDLSEENLMQNKHILKLKEKNELLIQEATEMETNLNKHIQDQQKLIIDLENQIRLQRTLTKTTSKTVSIQTDKTLQKNQSTSTNINMMQEEISGVENRKETTLNLNLKYNESQPAYMLQKNGRLPKSSNLVKEDWPSKKINKVILLSDELGKGIRPKLYSLVKDSIKMISIVKPCADIRNVIENIEFLAKDFRRNDYIIIMAGKNDFSKKQLPSFRYINEKLKSCSSTNIIFSSVPYTKSRILNQRIYKYNSTLNLYIQKLNKVIEGNIIYYEINNENYVINKDIISKDFSNLINNQQPSQKSLIFIKRHESQIMTQQIVQSGKSNQLISILPQNTGNNNYVKKQIKESLTKSIDKGLETNKDSSKEIINGNNLAVELNRVNILNDILVVPSISTNENPISIDKSEENSKNFLSPSLVKTKIQ